MIIRLKNNKIIILLGLITAIALFGVLQIGMTPGVQPEFAHSLVLAYVILPVVLLLLAIYKFSTSKNRKLFTYAISVSISVVTVPILFVIGLGLLVFVTGIMPTPN